MPSRRTSFRRPDPPPIEGFVDRLERNLRQVMELDPPAPATRMRRGWDRWSRLMLRPVMQGGMALVMIVIFAVSVSAPKGGIVMDMPQRPPPPTSGQDAHWVEVVEVPDPVPIAYPIVSREPVSRFVVLVKPLPRPPFIPSALVLSPV